MSPQFEGEAEGARLRRDVTAAGGVAPVRGRGGGKVDVVRAIMQQGQ